MLRLLVEKTVQYARRVAGPGRYERTTSIIRSHERYTKARRSFERSVGMLRRETVRALRNGEQQLRYSRSGDIF